jgi:leucyl/phenylalanyl-tRNA--protein transferase
MGEALPTVSFDTDVEPVLLAIARPRARQTGGLSARRFLTTPLLHALATLFDAGHAHCVAARDGRGRLVGGAFGVAVGRLFILEGLSEEAPGAGTLVLARLAEALAAFGYRAIEAPPGSALAAAGFAPVGRDDFNRLLGEGLGESRRGRWPGEGAARFNPSDAPPAAEPDLRRAA